MPQETADNEQVVFEWSEYIQRDILNRILTDKEFFVQSIPLIKPVYFANETHKTIVSISQRFFEKYNALISKEALVEEVKSSLRNRDELLSRVLAETSLIYDNFCQDNAERTRDYLLNEIVKFARAQAMKCAILKSVELLEQEDYEQIETTIKEALAVNINTDLGVNYFSDVEERYRRLLNNEEDEKFTTGWESCDRDLSGGLGRKEVGIVFANSGVGKSLYLGKVAIDNIVKGKKVLYLTCELFEDLVGMRLDSHLTMVPFNALTSHFQIVFERLGMLREHVGDALQIKWFPAGAADLNDFRAYISQLWAHRSFRPDLIIVDYIDEMRMPAGLDLYQGQMLTARLLRGLAGEMDVGVFTATQANRSGNSVRYITENEIGDSYGKIRSADAVWSINQTDQEKSVGVGRIFVVKHRNGNSRYQFPIEIDYNILKMKEISQEEYSNRTGRSVDTGEILSEENT